MDATGYCFATRWLMPAGLPIVPLRRYYLREVGLHPGSNHIETITRYQIAGTPSYALTKYCARTPSAG